MKSLGWVVVLFVSAVSQCAAELNVTRPLSTYDVLPSTFKPPQVFKNANLLRNINLEKGYVKEQINVVIENVDKAPQQEYFVPFEAGTFGTLGGFEVADKKVPENKFKVDVVEFDYTSPTQFIRITLPQPLKTSDQQTLAISYHLLSALEPLPAKIEQVDKQYLQFTFSEYSPSSYPTTKQKTKLKFPGVDIPDYTGKPERQGTTFTYGPFDNIPAGEASAAKVRYEFTKPLIHANLLERDIEVSHWGGNVAFEDRYWLTNKGANLKGYFNRVQWAQTAYQKQFGMVSSAISDLKVPLKVGSIDPYFTDDIGNVSTSKFRSSSREALLELKPRYPIFGGWNFPFRIGYSGDARRFLRSAKGSTYVLNVPFLEGPKMPEGTSYGRINLRVILPEGATNIKYESSVPLVVEATSLHKTFMDTLGRTSVELTAVNVIDESRDKTLIVTYNYSMSSMLRKPLTIIAGTLAVFVTAWAVSQVDVSIGKKKA